MKITKILVFLLLFGTTSYGQKSIDFDGINDVVTTTSAGITGIGNRTVELWLNTTQIQSTQQVLVDMGNMATGGRFTFKVLNISELTSLVLFTPHITPQNL